MARPPKNPNSSAEKELHKAEQQFEAFEQSVKDLTLDRMNAAPKEETEGPKISQREIERAKEIHLKPKRSMHPSDPKTGKSIPFNEKFRSEYEFNKQEVQFIAENREIGGEDIPIWTKPYAGVPAEEWSVPVNKPVWGPRYLAEQIKRKYYHRLVMQEAKASNLVGGDYAGQYFGSMTADTTIQRLDAHPVNNRKSIFMGGSSF